MEPEDVLTARPELFSLTNVDNCGAVDQSSDDRRMPRVQVHLPDQLYAELKQRDIPASELLQIALRAEIECRDALDATDECLLDLAAGVGTPSERERARARKIVRRVQERLLNESV